jgi:integrase
MTMIAEYGAGVLERRWLSSLEFAQKLLVALLSEKSGLVSAEHVSIAYRAVARGRSRVVEQDAACRRLMTVPGIGPIISSAWWLRSAPAMVAKRQLLTRGHHAAMNYTELPAFIGALQARQATASLALEFAILTAARSGEVLGARWDELDLDRAVRTVPASRMRAGREHRVPLRSRHKRST